MSWLRALSNRIFPRSRGSELSRANEQKQKLASEQMRLADELEQTVRSLDARLRELASRVHEMDDDTAEAEIRSIEEIQRTLRLSLRRLDASSKATQDISRELKEWEDRGARERVEILRSELAVREPSRISIKQREPAEMRSIVSEQKEAVDRVAPSEEPMAIDSIPDPDTEHLVRAIREATREAERWHAVPSDEYDEDALVQLHHVRELHALLKQLDREQGIARDRIELAVHPRDIH